MRVSPEPPAFNDKTKNGTVSSSWNCLYAEPPVLHFRSTMQNKARAPKDPAQKRSQRRGHFAELGEHQHLFLPRCHDLGNLPQAGQFAAVLLGPGLVVQPLRGMIADLLQPHQHGQDHALALNALGFFQALCSS